MTVMAMMRSGREGRKDDTTRDYDTTRQQRKIMEMLKFTPGKMDDALPPLDDLLTPPSKATDTPLAVPLSAGPSDLNGSYMETCRRPLGRFFSFDVKRSLFSGSKRPLDGSDVMLESPVSKRLRQTQSALSAFSLESPCSAAREEDGIKTVVQRLATDDTLLADGSRAYTLPCLRAGKHQDLKAISSDTMCDVLDGCYDDKIDHVTVIDCRYPYEFEGGHIKDAINLFTHDAVSSFLHEQSRAHTTGRHILVFHCEFSSERGPKMYRYLRSQDRDMNKEQYPALHFPEIYLLEGGYKAFFHTHKSQCFPPTYMPMNHKDYAAQLRHFRGKSKSWTAGERKPMSRFTLRF